MHRRRDPITKRAEALAATLGRAQAFVEKARAPAPAVDATLKKARAFVALVHGDADPQGQATLVAANSRTTKDGEDGQMELPNIAIAADVQKTVWGSPAGKKRLAARLATLPAPRRGSGGLPSNERSVALQMP